MKDKKERRQAHDTGECRLFKCSLCGYGVLDIFLKNETDYDSPVGLFNFCPWCGAEIVKETKT